MKAFVAESTAKKKESQPLITEETDSLKTKKILKKKQQRRIERRIIREQRLQEDAAWKQLKTKLRLTH